MSRRLKQLIQWSFLEDREAQELQDCVEASLDVQALADDRDGHVDRHGDPDLALHRVFRGSEERLYSQVLLDPFEEVPLQMLHFREFRRNSSISGGTGILMTGGKPGS